MVHTTDHVKDYGGKALFNDRGDAFTVCDLKADGMTAEAIVKIGDADGTTAYLSDLDGAGTCKHFTRNMPENHSFKMRVCLQKNYRGEYHCSNWAWGVA
ncbi:hypothetical protein San01_44600 [Streptomyces angustmyceticus]|uniref:Uncharacterized protein n=2 Tax=Streptomyces angustmyceticus TaxID=285578 RepID=A0A5J4LCR9_9ACTN|nr:hypothetical protein San01_44600 [Streptomyces angustmyceticus]